MSVRQIVQAPGWATIVVGTLNSNELILIPLDGRPAPSDNVRTWLGIARGHWDGNTLVVETTNFPQSDAFIGSWKHLKITERFTRVSPTRVNYQFQAEDPDTWDKPWGGEYDFAPLKGIVYEYACHEGNYALPAILAGARRKEQEATAGGAKPGGN